MTQSLAIIIPMYNEEATAERCVRAVCEALKNVPGTKFFAVNDGSRDRTLEILQELEAAGLPFQIISHSPNRGYGGALMAGAHAAYEQGFEFGLFMDSDLTNDPALIPQFAQHVATGKWDFVKASRYVSGGKMDGVEMHRQLFSIWGNRLASRLFNMGIRDCTNGFHAVRLSLVVHESFHERGFPFLMEELLLLKRKGAVGIEIPYTLTARTAEQPKTNFRYTSRMLWNYLKYALRAAITVPKKSTS